MTELAEAGWDLDSIECSDGNSTGTGAVATYEVAAGETVTCTFHNVKRGEVRVIKSTDPGWGHDGVRLRSVLDPVG